MTLVALRFRCEGSPFMLPQSPSGENPLGDRVPEETATPPGAGRPVPLWLLTLAAGLVTGLLSWLGGELTRDAFPATIETPPNVAKMASGREKSELLSPLWEEAGRARERNKTAAAYGLLGALLGAALCLVGGWSRGSAHSGWRGPLGAGLTAALAGTVLSWVLVPLMFRLQAAAKDADPDFAMSFLMIHCVIHAGIGAAIGVAAGLALGWGLGDRLSLGRALIGGFFGAVAGVLLFETINSLAFPLLRSEAPLPEVSLARLAMHLGVAGGAAFLAGLAADARPRRARSTSLAS
jgi:hypothetical protein